MVVEGETVPADVLQAEEKAKDHAAPHVNFYDPSVYKVCLPALSRGFLHVQRRDAIAQLPSHHPFSEPSAHFGVVVRVQRRRAKMLPLSYFKIRSCRSATQTSGRHDKHYRIADERSGSLLSSS